MKFQSAISRYLVSNLSKAQIGRQRKSFNPLYRGTWFPTPQNLDIDVQVRTSFNPLYRGTWFPTLSSKQTGCTSLCGFNPLYRGTWFPTGNVSKEEVKGKMFQSAISRYLVSNAPILMHLSGWFERVSIRYIAVLGFQRRGSSFPRGGSDRFNPLYRGTWFPTANIVLDAIKENVSIRYIAVLGFQHSGDQTPWMKTLGFQSAISRYLVSNQKPNPPCAVV